MHRLQKYLPFRELQSSQGQAAPWAPLNAGSCGILGDSSGTPYTKRGSHQNPLSQPDVTWNRYWSRASAQVFCLLIRRDARSRENNWNRCSIDSARSFNRVEKRDWRDLGRRQKSSFVFLANKKRSPGRTGGTVESTSY
jgi:hypothetical protein